MSQVIRTPEQQYCLTKLLGHEFAIEYQAEKGNMTIDALSTLPTEHIQMYIRLESAMMLEIHAASKSNTELLILH